jgi:Protein of unknown function (DUF2752)
MIYFITTYIFISYHQIINWLEGHMLTCPSKWLMKLDCPGCGLQTSIIALLRGQWQKSFAIYPATIPILLLFLFLALHLVFKFNKGVIILKGLYFFCAAIIFLGYIYKIISLN